MPNPSLQPTLYGQLCQASARGGTQTLGHEGNAAAIRVCGSRDSNNQRGRTMRGCTTLILSGWSAIWKLLLPNHHNNPKTAFWEIDPVFSLSVGQIWNSGTWLCNALTVHVAERTSSRFHFGGSPTTRSNEIAGLLHQAHGRILDPCLSVIRSGRGG